MAADWKEERHLTHRSFRIVDLVEDDDIIEGRIFEDCTIYGPAVLAPLNDNTFSHNTFEADPAAFLWQVAEDRDRVVGAIGLRRCIFRRCIFRRIGLAGKQKFMDQMLQAIVP